MHPDHPVNSRPWWDDYFRRHWDANHGSAQTAYFMDRLLDGLGRHPRERDYLAGGPLDVLDWGCAFGEGAGRIADAFPMARVAGLDFSAEAVEVARRRHPSVDFLRTEDGRIPRDFDVIVTSNCLEHFDDPLAVAERHLRSCRKLYLAMVPYREDPLCETHRSRFDERTFPERLGGFRRVFAEVIATEAPFWAGRQLLVAYGSREYLQEVGGAAEPAAAPAVSDRERAKWDAYYGGLADAEESPATVAFGAELAARIAEFLPDGGRLLEAGSGAGQQSMALARAGRYDLTLMDFSEEALGQARRWFGREGVRAGFVAGDVMTPGAAEYDLVFNAGVLEHYTFDEQVAFLRGMASRSRRFVLALVPNRLCYWYWIGRVRAAAGGSWPFGKEVPMSDLGPAFEAAGLTFLGQFVGGATWSENFINYLPGLDAPLRDLILSVHRSGIVPDWQRGYLVGALGSLGERPVLSSAWSGGWPKDGFASSALTATLADSLALAISSEQRHTRSEQRHTQDLAAAESAWSARVEAERAERDQLAAEFAARAAHQAATESALRSSVEEKDRIVRELTNRIHELTHSSAAERAEAARREADRDERHAEDQRRIAEDQRRIAELVGWAEAQTAEMNAIRSGRAWKLVERVRAVRRRLAPSGSLPSRAAKLGLRAVRKARQGPGPFARAVARRAIGGLPTSWRSRARDLVSGPRPVPVLPGSVASGGEVAGPSFGIPGLVSVILPVYNQADLLASSIESVLAQTYPDFELIVINDGSTDGVEAVLDEYVGHPRVRVLTQANQKLPKALSNGFDFARGEFWTWTSADNLMHPDQLARQVEFLRANPSSAMVYADYVAIDDRGDPLRDPDWRPHNRRGPDSPEIHLPRSTEPLNRVLDNFIGPCFMYRGWVGRLLGEYDPNLGLEDYDYWMRLNAQFRISHLGTDETLYQYRVHDNSLSGRAAELKIAEKALKLLDYERERAAYYAEPWSILVDAETAPLIGETVPAPHEVVNWDGGPIEARPGGKWLAIVGASTLPALAATRPADALLTAAWFATDDVDAPYRQRSALESLRAIAFAADEPTRGRLALLGVDALVSPPGDLAGLALRWANNRSFYELTRPEPLRRREPPRAYSPVGRRHRVLLQVDDFTLGGMERVVLALAMELDPRRFQFTLLVLGRRGESVAQAEAAGLRVVTLPEANRDDAYRRLLAEERIDLVHAHFSLYGAATAAALGVPFVQTFHGTPVSIDVERVAAIRANDRDTACYACVSNEVARYADARLGLPASKCVVIPNGVDLRKFGAPTTPARRAAQRRSLGFGPDDFVFLNVGSIYADKAQIPAVLALAELARSRRDARLVLLGKSIDPDYFAELKRTIDRHGLGGSVILPGHVDDPSIYYEAADAFLFPSYWEGWSLALAEALCAGLPVVATEVGAAGELVTPDLGWLVRPPYGAITEMDWLTIGPVVRRHDPAFVRRLAEAMRSACDRRRRVALPPRVRSAIDQRRAYQSYAELYAWLVQGGGPEVARRCSAARPAPSASQAPAVGEGIRAA